MGGRGLDSRGRTSSTVLSNKVFFFSGSQSTNFVVVVASND